ncbi:papain-like cysteine protease family protein [Amycolatopsis nigrescens]|uniref:papain-like cysteine protease family protein n=1 Tax=Amycolatopsis nigrescens TaxID=381445 RepID=UPI00037C8E4C|nr:papain-like cysteine protease family protein [Amycolatopsis nigrescens]
MRSPKVKEPVSRARRIGLLCAGLAATAAVAAPPATAATEVAPDDMRIAATLQINQLVQEQNQWCWAASGLTIGRYLGKGTSTSQNDFCNYARGYPQGTRCPNQPAELTDAQRGLQGIGVSPGVTSGAIGFSTVRSEIDGNRPIETGIYWTAGGGHAQVIHGYDAATQMMYYGDPWPQSARYSSMSYNSYVRNSQFQWGGSLYRIGA